MILFRNCKIHT